MALRPEDLPSDPARLIEMVLSLDAENDRLRAMITTFKDMVFGSRSEKLAAVVVDQLALDLADLATDVTRPAAANDDQAPSKPLTTGKPRKKAQRKKAQRNIGALPKHLPRCEQVIEPSTTECPCCQGRLHKIGQDVSEVLDIIPAILKFDQDKAKCARAGHMAPVGAGKRKINFIVGFIECMKAEGYVPDDNSGAPSNRRLEQVR